MKKLNEGSFHIFSEIPPKSKWLKSGTVDRQTSATDFVWQRRFMILTADDVVFAKPDSDVVVDRLPLLSVNFVGKVDNVREEHSQETATWSSFRKKKKIKRKNSVTALFTPAARPTLSDNAANPGDKSSKGSSFAFEIRTASEDRERSYFCRTATSEEREEWLAAVLSAVAAAASQKTQRNGAVERLQSRASALCESPLAKYVVTAAILVDFFSSVPAHAPPPPPPPPPPPQSRSESRRRRPKAAPAVVSLLRTAGPRIATRTAGPATGPGAVWRPSDASSQVLYTEFLPPDGSSAERFLTVLQASPPAASKPSRPPAAALTQPAATRLLRPR